ncbi:MAG: relaxase/mobilization nuclease domain-containing protein, partial [Rhizonema sp. PD38]|nr:relaxase/mobilization nuclease domain-containing protein [Rhizonema sp. PD38]
MIGNITKGNGFYGCTAYVLEKPGAQLINTNMAGVSPTQLAWEFRTIANFNHRVQKPVLHLSFSPAPGDRTLDEWELCLLAQDLLSGLNLDNNQFILVQHNDAEYDGHVRPHAHMVINRVSSDGKCNDDYLDYYRTEKILRQIEQQYDLVIQPSSWSVERKKPYPKQIKLELETDSPNIIQKLQTAILKAAASEPAMPVLVAQLLKDNIKVDVKYTRTGKVKGISYGIGEEHFAGNDLGKVFTFNGLQKHLGVSYDHSRDKPVIESLHESFTRGRVIDDARVEHLQNWLWWREREETLTATGDNFQLTASTVKHRVIATDAPTGVPSPKLKQTQPQELTAPATLPDSIALPNIFEKLKLSINAAVADYPSMPELIAKLYLTGVKVKVEFSTQGLAAGISYEIDGISINSSNLGEQYSFEGLQSLGVDYNSEWDNRLIETIVDYGREGHVID